MTSTTSPVQQLASLSSLPDGKYIYKTNQLVIKTNDIKQLILIAKLRQLKGYIAVDENREVFNHENEPSRDDEEWFPGNGYMCAIGYYTGDIPWKKTLRPIT